MWNIIIIYVFACFIAVRLIVHAKDEREKPGKVT
jgi:hypothetical protein